MCRLYNLGLEGIRSREEGVYEVGVAGFRVLLSPYLLPLGPRHTGQDVKRPVAVGVHLRLCL